MARELNLVPRITNKQKVGVKSTKTIFTIVLILLLSVGGSIGFSIGREILLNKRVEGLKEDVALNQGKMQKKNELDKQIKATTQQIEKAKQLKSVKNRDTDGLINELFALVKIDGVTVHSIVYESDESPKIEMSCSTSNKDSLAKVWANLRESEKFSNSHISGWSKEQQQSTYNFNISIIAKGGSLNGAK